MKLTKEQIREVNESLDMIDLIVSHGMDYAQKGQDRYMIHCPFHEGDNTASLIVHTDKKPHWWYCFGCKKGSDPIEFICLVNNKSFGEVISRYVQGDGIVTVEDQVRMILESGKRFAKKNRRVALMESLNIAMSIKVRTIIRKKPGKLAEIQSILMRVDDFMETDAEESEASLYEAKMFFREAEKEMRSL